MIAEASHLVREIEDYGHVYARSSRPVPLALSMWDSGCYLFTYPQESFNPY